MTWPVLWRMPRYAVSILRSRPFTIGPDDAAALLGNRMTPEQQAWAYLYEMVQRQALFLSFVDNFWRLAWIFVAVVPFVLFLGRRPRMAKTPRDLDRPAVIVEG